GDVATSPEAALMRVPLSWLREYVATDASDAEIARRLTISSLEVDRLIDVGNSDPQQIVCGAWNFGAGATVAVGLPGALLPGFPGPLEERKLRGEVSRGMILAEDEIGLGADHSGIMLLPDGLEPGTPLADVL